MRTGTPGFRGSLPSGSEGEIGGHPGYYEHKFVTSFPALPLSTYGL